MTADTVGGVWTYAVDLGGALVARGHQVTLAVCGPRPSQTQRLVAEAEGLTISAEILPLDWLCSTAEPVVAGARRLSELSRRYDVLLVNSPAMGAHTRPGVPVVMVVHGEVGTWWNAVGSGDVRSAFGWLIDLIHRGLQRADQVVTPTAAYGTQVREFYDLRTPPATVHNGRSAIALASNAAPADFALAVGRFWDGAKDTDTLDTAAGLTTIAVRAAGEMHGPQDARALTTKVDVLGSIPSEQLAGLFARQPVFVSTAVYEPFGLAVLEAAQAGCPLVLSDIPTFRELWDGVATFVTPRDAAAFARAIDAPTISGEAARERAARYTVAAMADGMEALIADVLRQPVAQEQMA